MNRLPDLLASPLDLRLAPIPQPDDQRTRPLRDSQGHAAPDQCMIIDHTREYAFLARLNR
jgi:hypothetical protein